MELNYKERQIIKQFKWITLLFIGVGVLVASIVFYSIFELKRVHEQTFDNVVAIEEGSVIILKLQKLVVQMVESTDAEQFSAYKDQFIAAEDRLYAYFEVLKTSPFQSEMNQLVQLYENWRTRHYETLKYDIQNQTNKSFNQDLDEINTLVVELEKLHYEDSDLIFHWMINRIQWSAYLLILVSVVLSIGIQIAVRRIDRTNVSQIEFIKENQLLYEKVAEAMPDSMLLIDNETGKLLDANYAAASMYGYSIAELLLLRNVDLSAEPDVTMKISKSEVKEVPLRYHKSRDGHVFPVEIRASRFVWKGRQVHMAWIHDISERIEMQRLILNALNEAKAGERSKSNFLANMSHEIRTPLNGIYGALQLIEMESLDPETRNLAAISLESSMQLIQMMDQILEYSMLETGDFEFQKIPMSLNQVISEVISLLTPCAFSKKLSIHLVNANRTHQWIGDPIRLKQLLIQLVSNAIKFSNEEGDVSLEVIEDHDNKVFLITVTDTGCGIKPEDIRRIFRWFEQVDLSQTKAYSGVGLGLATAKGIVTHFGGQILVNSIYGQGSTFTVMLPSGNLEG